MDYNEKIVPDFPEVPAQGRRAVKPSGAKQIAAHPAVQQAIEILGAELIEVKPSGAA